MAAYLLRASRWNLARRTGGFPGSAVTPCPKAPSPSGSNGTWYCFPCFRNSEDFMFCILCYKDGRREE